MFNMFNRSIIPSNITQQPLKRPLRGIRTSVDGLYVMWSHLGTEQSVSQYVKLVTNCLRSWPQQLELLLS